MREAAFWDEHVPTLDEAIAAYKAGPDPITAVMFERAGIGAGCSVLDFACGAGVTSLWMADRGAEVVGVDISPESIAQAREMATQLGVHVDFRLLDDRAPQIEPERFDALFGCYALHHVDLDRYTDLLAAALRPGGTGVFYETMATGDFLRAIRWPAGRFGIAKFSSPDEHPLRQEDINRLRVGFGSLSVETPEMHLFRILDRQVFGFRHRRVSNVLWGLDRRLFALRALHRYSYHQLVIVSRSNEA